MLTLISSAEPEGIVAEVAPLPALSAGYLIAVEDVDGFRQGDTVVTERVFKGMWARLYRAAYRILPDHDEAEEAAQQGFVKAYHARSSFRGSEGAALAAWLLSIVRRTALDTLRAKGKRSMLPEELPAPDPTPAAQLEAQETCARVRATLARLEPGDRAAIVLYELEELAQAEIADEMGITVNAFKVRLHRARRRFRELYQRLTDGGTTAVNGGGDHD